MTAIPSIEITPPPDTRKIRVLVVEDYRIIRLGLCTALQQAEDLTVVGEAETGEQAINFACRLHPDVILVDLGLPDMQGTQAIEKIRALIPDIQMVVLTSHNHPTEVLASLRFGAKAYCMKDIPSEQLMQVIRLVHQGGVWLDPSIAEHALSAFSATQLNTTLPPEENLTPRELDVLRLIVAGDNNQDIANKLFISIHTVKSTISNILRKLEVDDRVQAAVKALQCGLVQ